jgi:biopolymer transport protein ExbD
LQIRADKPTQWQKIATVMAEAKSVGMVKLGFMTTGGNDQ